MKVENTLPLIYIVKILLLLKYFGVNRRNIYFARPDIVFLSWKTLVYQILIDLASGSNKVTSTYTSTQRDGGILVKSGIHYQMHLKNKIYISYIRVVFFHIFLFRSPDYALIREIYTERF